MTMQQRPQYSHHDSPPAGKTRSERRAWNNERAYDFPAPVPDLMINETSVLHAMEAHVVSHATTGKPFEFCAEDFLRAHEVLGVSRRALNVLTRAFQCHVGRGRDPRAESLVLSEYTCSGCCLSLDWHCLGVAPSFGRGALLAFLETLEQVLRKPAGGREQICDTRSGEASSAIVSQLTTNPADTITDNMLSRVRPLDRVVNRLVEFLRTNYMCSFWDIRDLVDYFTVQELKEQKLAVSKPVERTIWWHITRKFQDAALLRVGRLLDVDPEVELANCASQKDFPSTDCATDAECRALLFIPVEPSTELLPR